MDALGRGLSHPRTHVPTYLLVLQAPLLRDGQPSPQQQLHALALLLLQPTQNTRVEWQWRCER